MLRLADVFWPLTRLFGRRGRCAPLHVTIYTRQGCHLCDDVRDCLRIEQRRHGFALSLVDVDTDPQLVASYGDCVPVVAVNGKVRFRGTVNPVLLARLLRAEAARTPGSPVGG